MGKHSLILKTLENGCIVPTSHKLNNDGYFRKVINGKHKMYHRYVYEQEHGSIPDGYEIDHKCKNRSCCNVDHLQRMLSSEHRAKDNMERSGNFSGKPLSQKFTGIRTPVRDTYELLQNGTLCVSV